MSSRDRSAGPVLATVNGRPIEREQVIDLLMRGRGAEVLEGIVVLEAAMKLADQRGITISQTDIDDEYDLALRQISDPLALLSLSGVERQESEKLLDAVLMERRVSREEFMIGMKRNACLRKLAATEINVSEEDLLTEFERDRGAQARVRHIQVATPSALTPVNEALARGEDFGELAGRYSANMTTAARGGILEPFGRESELVPAVLREVAFSLQPGQVSRPIRIGQWYHLVKLEEVVPARQVEFEGVRNELEKRLRRRAAGSAMDELYGKLLRQSRVEIDDPALRRAFRERLADRK